MSQSVDTVTAEQLQDTSRWFLREATLKAANTILVDHHHGLPLSRVWGDGSRSSSDGQRFAVERDSLLGSLLSPLLRLLRSGARRSTPTPPTSTASTPRCAISCAPREAGYVLDGILENDTLLTIREHTTDTTASPSTCSASAPCSASTSCRGSRTCRTRCSTGSTAAPTMAPLQPLLRGMRRHRAHRRAVGPARAHRRLAEGPR